ncbi:VOC family protein [Cryobacterium melibiosiphilum]|uniref:Bleomycin resistance protein n=1 Tax=Cryobacterium melibiosiphilum TaxID=995039 RepID=A0A3A5MFH9_9MICO|nr:VOC family protein [Cryobacterium melibiosiphilum]RJT88867.1 VOC family protein [Cryobacterium melibiosiphilum]
MSSATPVPHAAPVLPDLVPELLVTDLATSLDFWVDLCGFQILYDRPAEGFAYLHLGTAHVMLDQIGLGRDWVSGPLEQPLGRGVNFQVSVPAIEPLIERMCAAGQPLILAPEDKWYPTGDSEAGLRQFLVQDPDGYLVRFAAPLPARDGFATQ